MPFVSDAQRRFMHAKHPKIAKRWEKETPKGIDLPEHVKKAMLSSFTKIAVALKRLPPVPAAVLQQKEAMQAMAMAQKGLSPIAARTKKSAVSRVN